MQQHQAAFHVKRESDSRLSMENRRDATSRSWKIVYLCVEVETKLHRDVSCEIEEAKPDRSRETDRSVGFSVLNGFRA